MKKSLRASIVAAVSLMAVWTQFATPLSGNAQTWSPKERMEIIVGWGVGGGPSTLSDLIRRIAATEKLSPQPLFLTHKPGASGMIGNAVVANRRGDPHVFMPAGGALILQTVTGESKLDLFKDFTPLALSQLDSTVIMTRAKSEFKTIQDVINKAKKAPKSVTLGVVGSGGWDTMSVIMLSHLAGVKFNEIPFDGGAQAQAAVLGGQVDVATRSFSDAINLIKAGEMRALVIFDAERNPAIPNVPTMRELGYDTVVNLARGWFGPGGLTKEQVQWYEQFFKKISESPLFIKFCEEKSVQNKYMGHDDWVKFIQGNVSRVTTLYKQTGVIK